MYTLVDIEAKKTVLEATKKAAVDAANLAISPLQAQISRLENDAHKVVLEATQKVAHLDGQLATLEEMAVELRGQIADKKAPDVETDAVPASN